MNMDKRKLKIAIGATLHKKVRKQSTGGTEVFAYLLTRELAKRGHDVTVFASGDSQMEGGRLEGISTEEQINKFEQSQRLFYSYQMLESQLLTLKQKEFDVIHINYFEPFLFTPFSKLIEKPVIYSVHSDLFVSPLWQKVTQEMVKPEDKFIFVSKNAYEKAPHLTNRGYVYNGIDLATFPFSESDDGYLLWLGRVRKKKGIKEAALAAVKSGERLIMAGVIDNPEEKMFFQQEVEPLIKKHKNIEFVGEVNFEEKIKLYQKAKAFLFPVTWEEPFGLTMIEAMACGTPVVAFNRGAVSEVVDNNKTGFVVENIDQMAEAFKKLNKINRFDCRRRVEENFSLQRMVDQYEALYYEILKLKGNR
jgi:glycosyltransferase involved in cell wall biosynthesis